MAQKLNPFSGRQFLDANGDPYVGAQLFTYVAGSSTKSAVTKDSAGASSHANPIILNSRGEPGDGAGASQAIWQPDGVSIKLVLAPATDTDPPVSAVSTWDNLDGVNDSTLGAQDQWVSGPAPTYVSATTFTLSGDQTTDFHVGRRLKTINTAGAVYGTITDSAYTSLTTITVANDSGVLDSGLSSVSYGLITSTNNSLPGGIRHGSIAWKKGADIASATALSLGNDGSYFDITGTTTITSIATKGVGTQVTLQFDGVLLLTHNATSLILPGGADITTRAGDIGTFYEYSTGNWVCLNFQASSLGTFSTNANGNPNISDTIFIPTTEITTSTWESVGPTGSGADNIWTALDGVPSDVDWVEVKTRMTSSESGGTVNTSRSGILNGRDDGSTESPGVDNRLNETLGYTSSTGNGSDANTTPGAKLQVTSRVFEMYWASTWGTTTAVTVILTGYGYNP